MNQDPLSPIMPGETGKRIKSPILSTPLQYALLLSITIALVFNYISISYFIYTLIPIFEALYLTGTIFLYGFFIFSIFSPHPHKYHLKNYTSPSSQSFIASFSTGLLFTTLFFLFTAYLGIVNKLVIFLFFSCPLFIFIPILSRKKTLSFFTSQVKVFFKRPVSHYLVLLFPLIYALLPPAAGSFPPYTNFILQNHGISSLNLHIGAGSSLFYDFVLIPARFISPNVPPIFHFIIAVILIFIFLDIARHYFDLHNNFIPPLIFISFPIINQSIITMTPHVFAAFFIAAAIRFYYEEKTALSGLCWAFAAGIHIFLTIPIIIFIILDKLKAFLPIDPGYSRQFLLFIFALILLPIAWMFLPLPGVILISLLILLSLMSYVFQVLFSFKHVQILFILVTAAFFVYSYGKLENQYRSYYLYSGKMDTMEYKSTFIPSYPAYEFIDEKLPDHSTFLLIGDQSGYYLQRPFIPLQPNDPALIGKYISDNPSPSQFAKRLNQAHIQFIIVDEKAIQDYSQWFSYLTPQQHEHFRFLLRTFPPIYSSEKEKVSILKVH